MRLRDLPPKVADKVRAQKKASADAERKTFIVWCRGAGLPEPVPEFHFHPVRGWRFDWAWPERKVALEIEGGVWGMGKPCPTCKQRRAVGHTSGKAVAEDIEKYSEGAALGWKIVRTMPDHLYGGVLLDRLKRALAA